MAQRRTLPTRRLRPRLWSDHSRVWWARRRRTRSPTVTPAPVTLEQVAYRGRLDDGTELTANWITDPSVPWHQRPDTLFRLRFLVGNAGLLLTTGFQAYYRLNGGTWTQVTGSSSVVRAQGASGLNDGGATTEQLAGAATFVAGNIDEADGAYGSVDLLGGYQTELEGAYVIRSADTDTGDVVEIRLHQATTVAFAIYTETPALIVADSGSLTDDFSAYTLGTDYVNGDNIGTTWRVDDLDGGSAEIVTFPAVGNNGLRVEPDDATGPGDTFSPLVWSHKAFGPAPYEITASYQTSAQLRTGSSPVPSEMTWLLWGLCDAGHYYYLALRPDGWEIGKHVEVAGLGHEVILSTGTNPETDVAETVTVRVAVTISSGRPTIVARANGRLLAAVTDTDTTNAPNLVGVVGLYNRDARSLWDYLNVSPDITPAPVVLTRRIVQSRYTLVCKARLPQASSTPLFLDVDPIDFTTLTYVDELNAAQTLEASCLEPALTEPVRQRLREPASQPSELWLMRDGEIVFAGPLIGWDVQNDRISLKASGLLSYLKWMIVDSSVTYTATDQFSIAAALVNQWQALEYGNFGIVTSNVGLSGVTATVEYKYEEWTTVDKALEELSKRANGFDYEIDPGSRNLLLWYPTKSVDRSTGDEAVVFDKRNIDDRNVSCAVGVDDVATVAYASSTDTEQGTLTTVVVNGDLLAQFGRAATATNFDKITDAALLSSAASGLLDSRDDALLIPGPSTRVTPDSDLLLYGVGDSVQYALHDGLGLSGAFRVRKRTVTVSETGQETAALEFV